MNWQYELFTWLSRFTAGLVAGYVIVKWRWKQK